MIDDDLRAVMREHDHEAPTAAEFLARHHPGEIQLRKKRWIAAGAAAACVVAIAVGISIAGLSAGHNSASLPHAGGTSPVPTAGGMTCPRKYQGDASKVQPWVPTQPDVAGASTRLAPDARPTTAVVCAYQTPGASAFPPPRASKSARSLAGGRVVQSGLSELATALAWAPRRLGDQQAGCGDVGGIPSYDYLVGVTYSTGREWVSVQASDCGPMLSNGKFQSLTSLIAPAQAAASTGQWPAASARTTTKCNWQTGARWGQESSLVPPGSTSLTICPWGQRGATFTQDFSALVDTLNALPAHVSTFSCDGSPHGVSYTLRFSYPVGPDANVAVTPFCRPAIDNGSLQARDDSTVLPIIEQLLNQH